MNKFLVSARTLVGISFFAVVVSFDYHIKMFKFGAWHCMTANNDLSPSPIQFKRCNDTAWQRITFQNNQPYSPLCFKIQGLCVSNFDNSVADNVQMILRNCLGHPNQRFNTIGRSYETMIQIEENGMCLLAPAATGGAIVQTYCNKNSIDQGWTISVLLS